MVESGAPDAEASPPAPGEGVPASAGEGSGAEPAAEPALSSRTQAVHGTAWTLGGFVFGQGLRFVNNLVLGYLLAPEVFGLLALADILLRGLGLFSDFGIGPSIIQNERGKEPAFLNTAWTIQTLRGLGILVVGSILALPFAEFYGEPRLMWIIPVAALNAVLMGFQSTAPHTLGRDVKLGRLTVMRHSSSIIRVAVTLTWAWFHPSIWALLVGSLISEAVFLVLTHVALPGVRNWFRWDRSAARELFQFGKWVFVSTLLLFFASYIDRVLLGKLVPIQTLGVFYIASMFASIPMEVMTRLAQQVQFPLLAKHARSEPEALGSRVLASRSILLPAGVAMCLGLIFLAPWFFRYVYNDRYIDASWIAPLLVVRVWFLLLQATADRALLAIGNTRALAVSNLVRLLGIVAACLLGQFLWGLPGFLLGLGAGAFAGHVVVQVCMARARMPILAQDTRYTVIILTASLIGLGAPRLTHHLFGAHAALSVEVGLTVALLGAVSAWSGRRLLVAFKNR